jgi:hypothetical protein
VIRETIVTTRGADGLPHVAPLGLIEDGDRLILAPFAPSRTLDNLRARPVAVANYTDDVAIFAGCLTGRRDWPCVPAERVACDRLAEPLAHEELEVADMIEEGERPRFSCRIVHRANHRPFLGLNRARAAVLEAAILVSRLSMLPAGKIDREMDYLSIAVGKTAGPREREAWGWLVAHIAAFRAGEAGA